MLRFSRMTAETPPEVLEESTQVVRMLKNGEDLANFDANQYYSDDSDSDEGSGECFDLSLVVFSSLMFVLAEDGEERDGESDQNEDEEPAEPITSKSK